MGNLSDLSKKMILVIAVYAGVFCLGGLIFFRSIQALPFAGGVVAMCIASVGKIMLLERMMKEIGASEGAYSTSKVYVHHFLRFVLTAMVLLVAGLLSFTALIGACFGVFSLPVSGFAMKYFPDLN